MDLEAGARRSGCRKYDSGMATQRRDERPDLVDQFLVGERLGVAASTVARWNRRGLLPPPDLLLAGEEIWLWSKIYTWAAKRRRADLTEDRSAVSRLPDVVTMAELAERLGVPIRTITGFYRRGQLPDPDYQWQKVDAWLWVTVQKWVEGNAGRLPGLPRQHAVALQRRIRQYRSRSRN